jgi:hypothetical protein
VRVDEGKVVSFSLSPSPWMQTNVVLRRHHFVELTYLYRREGEFTMQTDALPDVGVAPLPGTGNPPSFSKRHFFFFLSAPLPTRVFSRRTDNHQGIVVSLGMLPPGTWL